MFKEARDILMNELRDDEGLVVEVCMEALRSNSTSRELIEDFDMKFAREHENFSEETKHNLNNYRSNIRCSTCYYYPVSELLVELLDKKQLLGYFSYELIRCIVYDAPLGMYIDDQYLISDLEVEVDTILYLHIELLKTINNSAMEYFKDNPPQPSIDRVANEIKILEIKNTVNNTTLYGSIRNAVGKIVSSNGDIIGTVCNYELRIKSVNTVLNDTNLARLNTEIKSSSFHMSVEEYGLMMDYFNARKNGTSTFMSVSKLVGIRLSGIATISKFVGEVLRGAVSRNDLMVSNEKMHSLINLFELEVVGSSVELTMSFRLVQKNMALLLLSTMTTLRKSEYNIKYDSELYVRLEVGIRRLGDQIKEGERMASKKLGYKVGS